MNKQSQFKAALTMLSVAVKAYASGACATYWNGVIDKGNELVIKDGSKGGDVQSTLSNPLAYYVVPLYEHNCFNAGLRSSKPKGRDVDFTMAQFVRALKEGHTNRADKIARISADITIAEMSAVNKMVQEGYAKAFLRGNSRNKEVRGSLTKQANLARQLRQVPELEEAQQELEL